MTAIVRKLALASATAALALGGQAAYADHHMKKAETIRANVVDTSGASLGMVTLVQTPNGVLVKTDIKGLPEGEHGFHFHQKGVCEPGEGFKSAGGHFAGGDKMHGIMVDGGPHGGDMPNQFVGSDGILKTQILNDRVTLGEGPTSLIDADGSAMVIHSGADDYESQPSGAAGSRIACAVLSPPQS